MKGIKKENVDYETLTVLSEMRERAFSDEAEDAHMAAALYCGALFFARERRLIQKDFARILFNQFQRDFESSTIASRRNS